MNKFLFSLLFLLVPLAIAFAMPMPQGQGGEPPGAAGTLMGFFPIIAIIAIFYFLILRPQNKKQKETQKMLAALKKGDRVVTVGGIHGTIQTVRENTVIIRVDDNTKLEFSRSAVSNIVALGKEDKDDRRSDASDEDDETDEK